MPTLHQNTNKCLARLIFRTISCACNHPGSGRNSQCWIASVLLSALRAQGYTEDWKMPTGWVAVRQQGQHTPLSRRAAEGVRKNLIFCPVTPLQFLSLALRNQWATFTDRYLKQREGPCSQSAFRVGVTQLHATSAKSLVVKHGTAPINPWPHVRILRSPKLCVCRGCLYLSCLLR